MKKSIQKSLDNQNYEISPKMGKISKDLTKVLEMLKSAQNHEISPKTGKISKKEGRIKVSKD